jgi:hypothetical protein
MSAVALSLSCVITMSRVPDLVLDLLAAVVKPSTALTDGPFPGGKFSGTAKVGAAMAATNTAIIAATANNIIMRFISATSMFSQPPLSCDYHDHERKTPSCQ